MDHLQMKPFHLTDEDILWVANTFADMTEEEKINCLLITPERNFPLIMVTRMSADRIKSIQNEGQAACISDFPGDEVDIRDRHLVTAINTFSTEKWDAAFGINFRDCIYNGALAVSVAPILFPAYLQKLNPDIPKSERIPASLSYELTTMLLKEKLRFNGLVIATRLISADMPRAIAAGCDIIIATDDEAENIAYLKKGVAEGIITPERLREAVIQILGFTAALGLHRQV